MRSIVFSTVSHLDMYTGEDRKDRWRPLLELLRIHDFKVDRYFFISHLYWHIVPTLVKDMNNVCPETEIVPAITNLNGVLTQRTSPWPTRCSAPTLINTASI
ncbi:MAG: RNA repair transcriptional activator RtcR family protein [Bilophila wadsworthia]